MKRFSHLLLVAVSLSLCSLANADLPLHNHSGTSYGKEGADAYAASRHGPDGALFLDPFFLKHLDELEAKTVLDAGCGAAPWAIYAAKKGAKVYGIDIQPRMIEQGELAVKAAGLSERVTLQMGDVSKLPYANDMMDKAMSINVGCNLPSSVLTLHISEMKRTLKDGGVAVITGPTSFGLLFANDRPVDEVQKDIDAALARIGESDDSEIITRHLNTLTDVYRATFAFREGRLWLVKDESVLNPGEKIWRKIAGLTVPNFYHSESEYYRAVKNAGFKSLEVVWPSFENEEARTLHNASKDPAQKLGKSYIKNPAFFVLVAKKST